MIGRDGNYFCGAYCGLGIEVYVFCFLSREVIEKIWRGGWGCSFIILVGVIVIVLVVIIIFVFICDFFIVFVYFCSLFSFCIFRIII